MALAFLSKKSWHVANFTNQEAVWKAEQVEAAETRKLEEWKTKREEERQIEELRRLQRESGQGEASYGGKHAQERVDFLYEQQTTKKEEYLLGKPVDIEVEKSDVKQVEALPGANFLGVGQNNLSSSANEEFNKMNNDPLVAMRTEEQKALQRLLSNPIKMKAIQGAVEEQKHALLDRKKDKKEKQRHKDKHKDRHKDKHRDREHRRDHKHRGSTGHRDRDDSRDRGGGRGSERGGGRGGRSDASSDEEEEAPRHRSRDDERRRRRDDSDDGPDRRDRRRDDDRRRDGRRGDDGRRRDDDERDEQRGDGRAREPPALAPSGPLLVGRGGLQMYNRGEKLAASEGGGGEFEACEHFEGPRAGYAFKSGPRGVGYYRDGTAASAEAKREERPLAPPSSARPASSGGGGSGRSGGGGSGRSGGSYRPGKGGGGGGRAPMSAAEREEKVRMMMSDADAHESERRKRSKHDEARSREEAQEEERERMKARGRADEEDDGPGFVKDLAKATYSGGSVAERINQQKHYLERGGGRDTV